METQTVTVQFDPDDGEIVQVFVLQENTYMNADRFLARVIVPVLKQYLEKCKNTTGFVDRNLGIAIPVFESIASDDYYDLDSRLSVKDGLDAFAKIFTLLWD